MEKEPQEAFPYTPPDASLRTKYGDVFSIIVPPKERLVKLAFDKMFAMLALAVASPILCAIFAAHFVLALFIPDQRGRLLIRYTAVSQGKIIFKIQISRRQGCVHRQNESSYTATGTPTVRNGYPKVAHILGGSSRWSTWMNCRNYSISSSVT